MDRRREQYLYYILFSDTGIENCLAMQQAQRYRCVLKKMRQMGVCAAQRIFVMYTDSGSRIHQECPEVKKAAVRNGLPLTYGGKVWESNPPEKVYTPHASFED